MPFKLPDLPYAFDALEPHIDAQTMQIHHDKHHGTYVKNLNAALEGTTYADWPITQLLTQITELPDDKRVAVRNNGGGHYNHMHFWQMLKPGGGGEPAGELKEAIERDFGSFDAFKQVFSDTATKHFGSGWAWLIRAEGGTLTVGSTLNQDNPIMEVPDCMPILGLDVWEHAYYLKYQNVRADYIAAWWNVINWDYVAELFASTRPE